MAETTPIEWTDSTWNPTVGCSIISSGCTNCYAMKMAGRLEAMGSPIYRGHTTKTKAGHVWNGKVDASNWGQVIKPLSWKKPRRIFVNSMSDLFHDDMPIEVIDQVFAVMALCPQHTFQVLTKRFSRMRDYIIELGHNAERDRANELPARWQVRLSDVFQPGTIPLTRNDVHRHLGLAAKFDYDPPTPRWPLPNVWLGASVENQDAADYRVPALRETPAAVRFLSCEPLLGPLEIDLTGVDWVIAGGESGPGARPMHPDWARSLRDQCVAAGVPFFFKQWGEWTPAINVEREHGIVQTATWFADCWGFNTENLTVDSHIDDEPDLYRVGKKAAGHLLDGVEWRQFPEPRP